VAQTQLYRLDITFTSGNTEYVNYGQGILIDAKKDFETFKHFSGVTSLRLLMRNWQHVDQFNELDRWDRMGTPVKTVDLLAFRGSTETVKVGEIDIAEDGLLSGRIVKDGPMPNTIDRLTETTQPCAFTLVWLPFEAKKKS
jgi:hypothetical protein